jgi:hypothetical protein
MRTLHQPDLSHFREAEQSVSVGDTPILFGVLLCCFTFATVFVSLGFGLPG